MKKFLAIVLAVIMVLSMAACASTINETEVSVLWSDLADVKLPNSLDNNMDRAMYLESINAVYYDANGDQAAQTQQAQEVLDKGCAVLMVNLVDAASAQEIVDLAKAKNTPVVFFGCEVDTAVVGSYDKCVNVVSDHAGVAAMQAEQINEAVNDKKGKNLKKLDKNEDGTVTYVVYGEADVSAVENMTAYGETLDVSEAKNVASLAESVEMIITDSDAVALEVLAALQAEGYNDKELNTKCIPVYTVGSLTSAVDFTKSDEDLEEEDKVKFVFTVIELIGEGKLAGTVYEDYASLANAAAAAAADLIAGNAVEQNVVAVPYIEG